MTFWGQQKFFLNVFKIDFKFVSRQKYRQFSRRKHSVESAIQLGVHSISAKLSERSMASKRRGTKG